MDSTGRRFLGSLYNNEAMGLLRSQASHGPLIVGDTLARSYGFCDALGDVVAPMTQTAEFLVEPAHVGSSSGACCAFAELGGEVGRALRAEAGLEVIETTIMLGANRAMLRG